MCHNLSFNTLYINMYFEFFMGIIFSLIYVNLVFNKCGDEPNIKFNIPGIVKNGHIIINGLHIHHWLISSIILIFTIFYKKNTSIYFFIQGCCLIFLYQGLGYDDCFDFKA